MNEAEFLAALTGRDSDLKLALEALRASGRSFCLIGGLAVNHYAEPVVTLDADFAVVAATGLAEALRARGFEVRAFPHSLNAQLPGSRLRLQITVNSRYAAFPARSVQGKVLGFDVPVAGLEDEQASRFQAPRHDRQQRLAGDGGVCQREEGIAAAKPSGTRTVNSSPTSLSPADRAGGQTPSAKVSSALFGVRSSAAKLRNNTPLCAAW